MNLTIQHRTVYRYRRPVRLQPHRMMLRPRGNHDLRIHQSALDCAPAAELTWMQDVFGNMIAVGTFAEATAELVITGTTVVDQLAPQWPVFRIAPFAHSYPFDYGPEDRLDLGALRLPDDSDRAVVAAWAQRFVRGARTDTLSLLKDINAGLLDAVTYRIRDEEGTQSAAETLALASGSCRDIAALFIALVRTLGFGARAVSGYLYDAEIEASTGGSTHAWAEVYLPEAGWIAFDPTHRRVGGAALVAVAVGRSNRQIMPITGGYIGDRDDFLSMDVAVAITASGS